MKESYENELELKQDLDKLQVRYGKDNHDYDYLIYYQDNKSGATINKGIFDSPITGIRFLPVVTKNAQLPVEDVDIVLIAAIDVKNSIYVDTHHAVLSPYIYFKKETKVEIKDSSVNS